MGISVRLTRVQERCDHLHKAKKEMQNVTTTTGFEPVRPKPLAFEANPLTTLALCLSWMLFCRLTLPKSVLRSTSLELCSDLTSDSDINRIQKSIDNLLMLNSRTVRPTNRVLRELVLRKSHQMPCCVGCVPRRDR